MHLARGEAAEHTVEIGNELFENRCASRRARRILGAVRSGGPGEREAGLGENHIRGPLKFAQRLRVIHVTFHEVGRVVPDPKDDDADMSGKWRELLQASYLVIQGYLAPRGILQSNKLI